MDMNIPTPIPAQPTRFLDKVRDFIRMRLYPESHFERIAVFIPGVPWDSPVDKSF